MPKKAPFLSFLTYISYYQKFTPNIVNWWDVNYLIVFWQYLRWNLNWIYAYLSEIFFPFSFLARGTSSDTCTKATCKYLVQNGLTIRYLSGHTINNTYLNATALYNITVPTLIHCLQNCSSQEACASINYYNKSVEDNNCQLLTNNSFESKDSLLQRSGWVHVSTDVSSLVHNTRKSWQ